MALTIKIGHASISENNTAYGQAGDSTGKEVCIKQDFNITSLNPNVLLRPKNNALAEASALACEAGCLNENIGYSQSGRNTLYSCAAEVAYNLTNVKTKCNTDCSAYMTVCAIAGGANITYGTNAPTTSNMRIKFKQSGDYVVLTDSKHLTKTDYLKRGDILVCEGRHTLMVLENGIKYSGTDAEPDEYDEITKTSNITTYSIDLDIKNIKETSAVATFTLIKHKNNVNTIITDTSKWNFKLIIKNLQSLNTTEKAFNTNTLTITSLSAGKSYSVQVNAIKAGTDDVVFCSAPNIFTTTRKLDVDNTKVEFGDASTGLPLKLVDSIYIKIKDTFSKAIIHKK